MKTFFIFVKSLTNKLKEISSDYQREIVSLVRTLGGDVGSMYIMFRINEKNPFRYHAHRRSGLDSGPVRFGDIEFRQ